MSLSCVWLVAIGAALCGHVIVIGHTHATTTAQGVIVAQHRPTTTAQGVIVAQHRPTTTAQGVVVGRLWGQKFQREKSSLLCN